MITLTGGNVQSLAGLVNAGGSMSLELSQDANISASPFGLVLAAIPVKFSFDSTANLAGSCKVWSNAELTQSTFYLVNFYDPSGARINQNPLIWQFTQPNGSSVDIGTVVPLNPNLILSGDIILSSTANLRWGDVNISRVAAGVLAVGTGPQGTFGGILGGLTTRVQIFSTPGTFTFTIPPGMTAGEASVTGAGAAAGGSNNAAGIGQGGSAGGTAVKWLTGLTPGLTITVTVGTKGTGVAAGTGGNGGNSSISSGTQTIPTVTGLGGVGGVSAGSPCAGNPGGSATNGDLNLQGGPGGGFSGSLGGNGGNSIYGGGGAGGIAGGGSTAGGAPGAGGGGTAPNGGSTQAGADGANGVVVFRWVS